MISIIDTKADIRRVYKRLKVGDRHKALLYSIDDRYYHALRRFLTDGWGIEVSVTRPSGMAWINNFNGDTAQVHFAIYQGCEDVMQETIFRGLDWFFTTGECASLYGITPKPYRTIFSKILWPAGFKEVLIEPKMCYMAKFQKTVPGVLTRLTKENWNNSKNNLWSPLCTETFK